MATWYLSLYVLSLVLLQCTLVSAEAAQGQVYAEIVSTLLERVEEMSKWTATDMRKFHKIVKKTQGNKEKARGGINSLEVKYMKLIEHRLKTHFAMLSNYDLVQFFEHGHTCSSQEVEQQMVDYKSPSICAETEPYKVAQLIWPEASVFVDIGVNRGFISTLIFSLWGGGGYDVSPISQFEIYKKHDYFRNNRNPGGVCHSAFNYGYPLYCPQNYRQESGLCTVKNDIHLYSIDGSPFIISTLQDVISNRHPSDVASHWKVKNFAMSDTKGFAEFTVQNETYMAGFEGGSITADNTKAKRATEKVPMTTLDDFANTYIEQKKVDIVKIDAEGFDTHVIRGAHEMLSERRVGMITWESGNPVSLKQNLKYLSEQKFDCYSPDWRGFIKLTGGCVNRLQRGGNVFCVSRVHAPGVALAFEALSRYHLPSPGIPEMI
jgi:FkbM family methyltransferase